MTTLDDYWPPVEPREAPETPRRHRHFWEPVAEAVVTTAQGLPYGTEVVTRCLRCGTIRDEAKARRGKSSRRLGGDQERRIERVYGPVKRGEYGDAVDHVGRVWRWQSKATRSLPPKWLAAIDTPQQRDQLPSSITQPHAGMRGMFDPRRSVVIRSFVSRGVRTRDWLFVHASDAYLELGIPEGGYVIPWAVEDPGWYVIPGDWWLDHFGRDA